MDAKQTIIENKTALGIELGSTRIKAVLIDENFCPLAAGNHNWENRLENGIWTYRLEDIWTGLQDCFKDLALDVQNRYGLQLTSAGAVGVSAMMHGYMVFDKNGSQLVSFRTWRNTMTEKASSILTGKFNFNIPQRWSISHLYQAILNNEPHVKDIDFMTTLAGYVHWKLTGNKALGINDASGVFPLDSAANTYDTQMLNQFDELAHSHGINIKTANIIPKVLYAGTNAGTLTQEGAALLDPSGCLKAGIPFCPPEGDAGTGMIATNSIAECTGNVSAGTSVFAMIVLEKPLSKVYPEIDIVATPLGKPVAMVHCNNCTGDLDAWVNLFSEFAGLCGNNTDKTFLYNMLYNKALEGDKDCGGLLAYNYISGEHITALDQGRPLLARLPDSNFSLANLMRTLLFSSMATLKYGMDILTKNEKVKVKSILGHGGLFKTKNVAQRFMAAAFNAPVSVMEESAGEGGAWGIALLAEFMRQGHESLEKFLAEKVFAAKAGSQVIPDQKDIESFNMFMERFITGLEIEKAACKYLKGE
jgi:sugar (pentulose or hexulose) kinase